MAVADRPLTTQVVSVALGVPVALNMDVHAASEVQVLYGQDEVAILDTDYTVQIAADYKSATVTPLAGLVTKAAGGPVALSVEPAYTQPFAISAVAKLNEREHEKAYDRAVLRGRRLMERFARTLRIFDTEPNPPDMRLSVARAGKVLSFDEAGKPALTLAATDVQDVIDFKGDAAASAAIAAEAAALASGILFGIALRFTFSETTTDSDPADGFLRLSDVQQNASTVIRIDTLTADGTDVAAYLDSFGDSTNLVKGHIRLASTLDLTKWLLFAVTGVGSEGGYRNVTVTPVSFSDANPFLDGDGVALEFKAAGNKGVDGNDGSPGVDGDDGVGVPTGGLATMILTKASNDDFDFQWTLPSEVVGFRAHKGANQTGIAASTYTHIPFQTAAFDNGGFFDTATGGWTPPAGVVILGANLHFYTGIADGSSAHAAIYKNGVALIYGPHTKPGSATNTGAPVFVVDLADGEDVYTVRGFTTSASTGVLGSTAENSYFFGYMIDATTVAGPPGIGIPPGGFEGQVLVKSSSDDFDTEWAAGGAGGSVNEAPHDPSLDLVLTGASGLLGTVTRATVKNFTGPLGATSAAANVPAFGKYNNRVGLLIEAADTHQLSDVSWLNAAGGTFFVEAFNMRAEAEMTADVYCPLFSLTPLASTATGIMLALRSEGLIGAVSNSVAEFADIALPHEDDLDVRAAMAVDSNGKIALAYAGFYDETVLTQALPAVARLSLGTNAILGTNTTQKRFGGVIYRLTYWPEVFPQSALEELVS